MKKSFTIHDLPASERPGERLQKFGVEALSAQEILALILGRGIAGANLTTEHIFKLKLQEKRGDTQNDRNFNTKCPKTFGPLLTGDSS